MEYTLSFNSYPKLCSVFWTLFLFCFLRANNTWQTEVRVVPCAAWQHWFLQWFLSPVFSDMRLRTSQGSKASLAETLSA